MNDPLTFSSDDEKSDEPRPGRFDARIRALRDVQAGPHPLRAECERRQRLIEAELDHEKH